MRDRTLDAARLVKEGSMEQQWPAPEEQMRFSNCNKGNTKAIEPGGVIILACSNITHIQGHVVRPATVFTTHKATLRAVGRMDGGNAIYKERESNDIGSTRCSLPSLADPKTRTRLRHTTIGHTE